ncbi:Hypothetical protein SCF082_LOCUS53019 [Durusdinium trenchii]|uniref:Uncharacterized protein n=1 Tax=Durusdinium trenchii TaxID=1381693 RepID=A0ABP0SQI0_9DINO
MPKIRFAIRATSVICGLLVAGQKFSCTQTTDTKGYGLNVFQTTTTNNDFCGNMAITDSVGELVDICSAFCGNGNIPLLVGIPSYGFNHADIDTVCLADDNSLAQYNASHMNDCRSWSQALLLIKTRAAELVAALDNITMAQLTFKAGIALKSKELAATMSSQETRDQLLSVTQSRSVAEYRSILEAGVADFLSTGKYRRDLQDTMEVLRNAGRMLDTTLNSNLPQLSRFVAECGDLLVSTGSSNEYLLDICIQRAAVCLDNPEAQHVGCCCSTIPLGGTFSITGEEGASEQQNSTDGSRRLQTAGAVDVCAEAEVLFSADLSQRSSELQSTTEGTALLQAHQAALRTAYPNFYTESGCRSRRLGDLDDMSLRHDGQAGKAAQEDQRRLQSQLSCTPQRATLGDTSYKAAFWAQTEQNYCVDIPPDAGATAMTDLGLSEICKSFCGENAIPLTIGGVYFGFNQTTMDGICLAGDIIEANSSFVSQCHTHARAMQNVQIKLAAFVSSLSVLEAEKTLYEANAKKAAADLKAAIEARASSVMQAALVNEKIIKLKELLIEETTSMKTSGSAYSAIQRAVKDVEAKGSDLQSTLSASLAALDTLVTDCNKLFTGVGASNEYLLDLCSQTSTACLDDDLGRHAGCCCGYSPLIALGSNTVPVATIDGLSNSRFTTDSSGRTRTAQRRLSTTYDVCGEAGRLAKPKVDEALAQVKALGFQSLIDERLMTMARRYPAQFGCNLPSCSSDTGGTCQIFSCSSGRGPTSCTNGKCLCSEGYCANSNGVCISVSDYIGDGATSFAQFVHLHILFILLAVGQHF